VELHQFRTDGEIDVTLLSLSDVQAAKFTALSLVAYPSASGIYRAQFVDEFYGRIAWDSYAALDEPRVGDLMFAGAS
jgi:hypothetical protein